MIVMYSVMMVSIMIRLYFLVVIVMMKLVCVLGSDYLIEFLFMLMLKKLFF